MSVFADLKNKFGIEGEVKLEHVLNFNDILESEETDDVGEKLGEFVLATIKECALSLDDMRTKEGANLAQDMLDRLGILKNNRIRDRRKQSRCLRTLERALYQAYK